MKNFTKKIGLGIAALFITAGAWSQCASITCPSGFTVANDSASCGALVTYGAPVGINICTSFTDTINYSGGIVQWTVPAGITSLSIEAKGAAGGYTSSSSITNGLGATIKGDFTVTPGEVLSILVGEQNNAGNGGGGGTFVVNSSVTPLVIAGGGGGASGAIDSPNKHGQVGTSGGLGAGGGGLGGTAGNGGSIGASFAAGAGGGLLTNGADGWTANSGGLAYVNGGAGANVGYGIGGFGGGGNGSGNQVGGGGGGYSGGGAGSNSSSAGVGGGGGSINNGTNQVNSAGSNSGHGMVILSYSQSAPTSLLSGLGSGVVYPIGTTTETYIATVSPGDTMTCSFTVTVVDTEKPIVTAPTNVQSCDPLVTGIAATTSDNCGGETVSYALTGATTGSGIGGDISGTIFNIGLTTVWYIATDLSGLMDSTSFDVNILPLPNVTIGAFTPDSICNYYPIFGLPTGTPTGGIYSGPGVSGTNFNPSVAGIGTHSVIYTFTDTAGCSSADTTMVFVDGCASLSELSASKGFEVYPNPSNGIYTVEFTNVTFENVIIQVVDAQGRVMFQKSSNETEINETIDITNASKGVYFIELSTATDKLIQKVIKD